MTVSRRQFLRISGVTLGGIVIYGSVPTALWLRKDTDTAGDQIVPTGYQPEMYQWAMAIDAEKCIGCRRCLGACERENHVPEEPGLYRTWLERYKLESDGYVEPELITEPELSEESEEHGGRGFFVPKLCMQCANPPCVTVCPVNATYRAPDGVVLMDKDRCIGCKYCVVACPYGARYLHPETLIIDKCTFCYHRITRGLSPACVMVCPTQARTLGNFKDKDDPVRQRFLEERFQVIKPSLGTRPVVYYTGLREGVR